MASWELVAADLWAKGLQGAKADILMKVSRTPRQWKSVCTELNINEIKNNYIPGSTQQLAYDAVVSLAPGPPLAQTGSTWNGTTWGEAWAMSAPGCDGHSHGPCTLSEHLPGQDSPLTLLQQTFSKPIPFDPSCSEREQRGQPPAQERTECHPSLHLHSRASQLGEVEKSGDF